MIYTDAHLHLQDPRFSGQIDDIITTMREAGITRCVVNGTSPDDWPKVSELANRHPDLITPSFGLHPWKTPCHDDRWKETLLQYLDKHPDACLGECGLDRWMKNPDRQAQEEAFLFHLALAAERNLPLSIHVLKAWGWLMNLLENHALPQRGFLLHSYGGSLETAKELLKLGAYFSFSGYFLSERKAGVREVFAQLPLNRLLLETDAPDMTPPDKFRPYPMSENTNHPANLPSIASGLSYYLQTSTATLASHINANFQRFFGVESKII
ncbi:TatD DNase family protein [Rubritalea squalenifaciens DSM 18772]|uniref:TatD DNase family protein n=1 Tax=Rubritalea squalenifaciens DSM 18772 TaxID=1123071 RepID=A0A1M6HVZ1_9BACT|nr:TatD family hydrolase [Rubritalea squalenifaciens]SHJ26298.1 TatD DNase family protein [Rubritalea squalenifaciens DSM 18772]